MSQQDGPSEEWLRRCRKRMEQINALPPELRTLVHEFGWTIIKAFLDCGVRNHRHIRHLIITAWSGSEQGVALAPKDAWSPLHTRDETKGAFSDDALQHAQQDRDPSPEEKQDVKEDGR